MEEAPRGINNWSAGGQKENLAFRLFGVTKWKCINSHFSTSAGVTGELPKSIIMCATTAEWRENGKDTKASPSVLVSTSLTCSGFFGQIIPHLNSCGQHTW